MKYWGLYWIISISLLFSCAGATENEVIKVNFGRLAKDADLFSKNVFKYYHLLYNKETRKMLCREVERNSWEWSFFHDAKALTENNELIFIADPESYNDALERKNTVFYQSGTPIQDAEASNNLLVKLSINW